MTETRPAFTPPVKDPRTGCQPNQAVSEAGNRSQHDGGFQVAESVAEFVRCLVMSTDARELIHFACLHNQRALYSTLREFIRLHMDKPNIPETPEAQFVDIASQFLTQAYCICHEPNNMWHLDNRWSTSWRSIWAESLSRFGCPETNKKQASSPATEVPVYEE